MLLPYTSIEFILIDRPIEFTEFPQLTVGAYYLGDNILISTNNLMSKCFTLPSREVITTRIFVPANYSVNIVYEDPA